MLNKHISEHKLQEVYSIIVRDPKAEGYCWIKISESLKRVQLEIVHLGDQTGGHHLQTPSQMLLMLQNSPSPCEGKEFYVQNLPELCPNCLAVERNRDSMRQDR